MKNEDKIIQIALDSVPSELVVYGLGESGNLYRLVSGEWAHTVSPPKGS